MTATRRDFLGAAAAAGAALPALSTRVLDALERRLERHQDPDARAAATAEEFWDDIRALYPQHDFIQLENGYSSPQPAPVLAAFRQQQLEINNALSPYMRTRLADDHAAVKAQLAELAGVSPQELVITRNTTESLGTVIHGIDLEPGDEAVMCDQDYGSMLEQFRQQARRRGLKLVQIRIPLLPESDEELVETYARALTPRTKLLLVSHMINITGQILPVRKIADMARARGVAVIVDAAHSFAQLEFKLPQLGGDYLGASLHKWLCTPLGAGLLHVKRDKIASVWPLLGDTSQPVDDIKKLERLGTQPPWTMLAIPHAIRFHNLIGAARKEARLRHLQELWTGRVRGMRRVRLNTPAGARACAIANVAIEGFTPEELAKALFERFRIYTVAIDNPSVQGVRVTPQVFTPPSDVEALVQAITALAKG